MLLYTIDRYAWEKYRSFLYICLILRIASIGSVLTDLKSAGSAEHNIYDSDVSDAGNNPLPNGTACSETHDKGPRPYDKLSKIIRAPHQLIHSCIYESVLIYFLRRLFLCICNAFKYLYRHNRKNGIEDIKKAKWYIDKYIEIKEGVNNADD